MIDSINRKVSKESIGKPFDRQYQQESEQREQSESILERRQVDSRKRIYSNPHLNYFYPHL
ncbi:hypothetical protein OEV98_05730 [Caldibacillus lycopersici]|uniref:Uncharacterized protein n=1 Tax=Perspicuibacillus lycopersici TaxID=1325689 RepID=A0AAE3IUG3_9BACI|nr:hypothetical protein [Perspicuibacillus lycopersici]MCU9613049.1 hypothetical protein [Perspicuibacillus lycopersici]